MTLKQFNADLAAAASKVKAKLFDRIISLTKGESDGELSITYENENLKTPLRIQVLIPNIGEYPKRASFLIFTENEDIPAVLAATLARLQDQSPGLDVNTMIITLSRSLTRDLQAGGPASDDDASDLADTEDECNYGSDDDDDDYDEDDGDELFGIHQDDPGDLISQARKLHPRLKQDLSKAREHGYKVGIIQSSPTGNIVSISVRASKFNLPEETLEVWGIRPEEYVVLLIHQTGPYITLEDIVHPKPYSEPRVEFRIGKCAHYKPSFLEALRAFHSPTDDNSPGSGVNDGEAKLKKIFISNSLDQFLAEGLLNLIKIRDIEGLSWDEANDVLLNFQIGTDTVHTNVATTPCKSGSAFEGTETPQRFRHDHLGDEKDGQRSWPLVAMQFAMRYLLACTRYCLRCHRRVQGDIETLKPYVCSNPLCLFQYLSMGLGPSAEHEIRSQPKVVDLLVSFCYTGLTANRSAANPVSCGIREFPVGLHLRVPDIRPKPGTPFLEGTISDDFETFEFQAAAEGIGRFIPKQWVAIRLNSPPGELGVLTPVPGQEPTHRAEAGDLVHCQIESIDSTNEKIHLAGGIYTGSWPRTPADTHKAAKGQAFLLPYVQEFDVFEQGAKRLMLAHLLATLPSISDIKKYLDMNPLSKVKDMPGVSPAAMSLLNWIIASNRSCIFETGDPKLPGDNSSAPVSGGIIPGMEGWVQFRFLQGSPDKEFQFQNARETVRRAKHLTCPSLFAWHGSALSNWHSIVRTGLDYAETHNGRAFGHGVYFSPDFATSMQYARSAPPSFGIWPNSNLRIVAAISLNEIVNSPTDFVSMRPHLVVAQPNWHMCRFLFVKCEETPEEKEKAASKNHPQDHQSGQPYSNSTSHPGNAVNIKFLQQDPNMTPKGPQGDALHIPLAALPSYHREKSQAIQEVTDVSDDSSIEHDSDTELLASEDDKSLPPPSTLVKMSIDTSKTDFRPGTLDLGSLPRLQPPEWSSRLGLKNITLQVRTLQTLQSQTPLHELGWYIDFNQLDNMFQWIVELHSFDPSLPLAADLKKAGLTSVVCEIRFGEHYPITPPFVRVIRPRFMPFMQGGGGHVTAGGAMCMELLTNSGWSPVSTIESVLLQVRMAITSTDPKPARLDRSVLAGTRTDYGIGEAVDAYVRAANTHGWKIPDDLDQMITGFSAAEADA